MSLKIKVLTPIILSILFSSYLFLFTENGQSAINKIGYKIYNMKTEVRFGMLLDEIEEMENSHDKKSPVVEIPINKEKE